MSEGKFEKSIWDSLSQDTKEICESIGSVPIGLDTFNEMYDDIAEKALKELKEKGLVEEMTLEEELKRKTEGFNENQIRQRIVQPKFENFLLGEKDALNAFDRLKSTSEDQLSSKRLRLTPSFGKFIENEIQYRDMTDRKEDIQGNLSELISPTLKREDFVKMVEDRLLPDEVINLGHKPEEAADKIVESLAYIGVFASKPATFDKGAFKFTGGFDLDDEAVDTVWNFLIRTGVFVDESETSPGRVSIEQKNS